MSLAYNLVNSLAETESNEDLTTLVIDHYTRTIQIPKDITNLGVESDDEVLRLKFKMPRYLGTVDLYDFNIRINYINAKGEDDVYKVNDATITGDYITFSWLVGPTATAYKGDTKFNVCLVVTNAEFVIQKEYNTAVASLPVLEGLECDERVILEYSDILQQWENRLFGIGDTEEAKLLVVSEEQQTNIADKGIEILENIADKGVEVLATIPQDYQSTYDMANNAYRTRANAIECIAEGETISINDSSDDYLRGLRIFGKTTQVKTTGKNLLDNIAESATINGITYTAIGNGEIRANGTASDDSFLTLGTVAYSSGVEYVISGCPSGGAENTYTLYAVYGDGLYAFDTGNGQVFTPDTDLVKTASIKITKGVTVSNLLFKPMVRLSSNTDKTYEPYSGGVASPSPEWPQELISIHTRDINTKIYGKNLLDDTQLVHHPEYIDTYSSVLAVLDYKVEKGKTYTLSFDTENTGALMYVNPNSGFNYAQFTMDGKRHSFKTTMTKDVTNSEYTMALVSIVNAYGVACGRISNVQIELGSNATAYEPYRTAQTVTLSERDIPGIPVTSGGNYTDSDGQQWVCDEIDFERGMYIANTHLLDCAVDTFGIVKHAMTNDDYLVCYLTELPRSTNKATKVMALSTHFPVHVTSGKLGVEPCAYVYYNSINSIHVSVPTTIARTKDELKQWLIDNEVKFLYPVENQTEIPLTAEEIENFKMVSSNFPNTTILNDSGAWMEVKYNADTQTYLERLPKATDAQVHASVSAWLDANADVTDEHINQLINTALGVIENGTY